MPDRIRCDFVCSDQIDTHVLISCESAVTIYIDPDLPVVQSYGMKGINVLAESVVGQAEIIPNIGSEANLVTLTSLDKFGSTGKEVICAEGISQEKINILACTAIQDIVACSPTSVSLPSCPQSNLPG